MAEMAGLLPTIKCSNCNGEVEISAMAEHLCSIAPQASPASPPPEPEQHAPFVTHPSGPGFGREGSSLKAPRLGHPPRIDSSAANRPFSRPDMLTPASSNGSRSASPLSPSGRRSPFREPQRSQTSPLPSGPPSPGLTNLDCAFPPFPRSGRSTPSQESKKAKPSAAGNRAHADSNPYRRAASPAPAPPPGPKQETNQAHRRGGSADSKSSFRTSSTSTRYGDPISRPSTSNSNRRPSVSSTSRGPRSFLDNEAPPMPAGLPRSFTPGSQAGTQGSSVSSSPPKRPGNRQQREGGYGGFDFGMTAEPMSYHSGSDAADTSYPLDRSQTLPVTYEERYSSGGPQVPLPRRPSGASDTSRGRRPTISDKDVPTIPENSKYQRFQADGSLQSSTLEPPPRSVNRIATKENGDVGGSAALSVSNFARALDINSPYTTAGSPTSSAASSPSETRSGSSLSSPPSEMSTMSRRKPSDLSRLDSVLKDLQPKFGSPREDVNSAVNDYSASPPRIPEFFDAPDSPTDPAIQQGRLSLIPDKSRRDRPDPMPPRPTVRRSATEPPVRRSTAPKRRCRGCGEVIMGKSVSSADGRLTGRYHKACFVCHTCRAPFQTADFYVLDDHPYCAQHYHQLNGSLCVSCNTGIEGQYLETNERTGRGSSDRQKFHPDCLKCRTCRIVLRGDYFEWNGHVYCERDARRAAASTPPPGRRRPTMPSSPLSQSYNFPSGPPPGGPGPRLGPSGYLGPPGGARRFPERRTTKMMMI